MQTLNIFAKRCHKIYFFLLWKKYRYFPGRQKVSFEKAQFKLASLRFLENLTDNIGNRFRASTKFSVAVLG